MKTLVIPAAIALCVASAALAQTAGTVVGTAPGAAMAANTVDIAATITAIDPKTRAVTLKGPQGRELSVTAGPEVKNFAQMKVGDQVNVKYVEALTLELKKGGGAKVERVEKDGAVAAKPGERPAGAVGRQIRVVADVVAVDAQKQVVTLKGPQRTVELKVRDPQQLAMIAKGDQVEAVFTEAMAIAVEPAKK